MVLIGVAVLLAAFVLNVALDAVTRHRLRMGGDPVAAALLNKRSRMPFREALADDLIQRSHTRSLRTLKLSLGLVALAGFVSLVAGILTSVSFAHLQLALLTAFASGTTLITYGSIARNHGWNAGTLFVQPRLGLTIAAWGSVVGALVVSLLAGPWWRPVVTLVGGFTASSLLVPTLRHWVQPLALLGIPAAWVWVVATWSALNAPPVQRSFEPWPQRDKATYVDRCTAEMAPQLPEKNHPLHVCQCLADSLEAEFGLSEYAAMMGAQPDPRGSQADRRVYRVVTSCLF